MHLLCLSSALLVHFGGWNELCSFPSLVRSCLNELRSFNWDTQCNSKSNCVPLLAVGAFCMGWVQWTHNWRPHPQGISTTTILVWAAMKTANIRTLMMTKLILTLDKRLKTLFCGSWRPGPPQVLASHPQVKTKADRHSWYLPTFTWGSRTHWWWRTPSSHVGDIREISNWEPLPWRMQRVHHARRSFNVSGLWVVYLFPSRRSV